MTTLTPVEQTREAYTIVQAEVERLSHEIHQLSRDRAVALAVGDVDGANKINSRISQLNVEYRLAGGGGGGKLADAQFAVNRAERELREARSLVADLTNAHNLLKKESIEALDRAQSLTSSLTLVQQHLDAAHEQLTQLEPPEPVAEPAPEPVAAPEVEREPAPERPYRIVGGFGGQARYYNQAGEETDAQNKPLLPAQTTAGGADDSRLVDGEAVRQSGE